MYSTGLCAAATESGATCVYDIGNGEQLLYFVVVWLMGGVLTLLLYALPPNPFLAVSRAHQQSEFIADLVTGQL